MHNIDTYLFIWLLILHVCVKQITSEQIMLDEYQFHKDKEVANARGSAALNNFPLVDGHNDLPWTLALYRKNQIKDFDFTKNLTGDPDFSCDSCSHTDLLKLRAGKVGGVFWAAYVVCDFQYKNAVAFTLEQIDLIKRLVQKYSEDLHFATTASGIIEAFKKRKIASLIGIEGGHSIEYKLSVLRSYYELGVRYMTLTHVCNTPWADSSLLDTKSKYNLTEFGKKVILEMNRLGMMIDLSHVSKNVMNAVLNITKAPVIFSHSSAYSVHHHHRNARDDVLEKLKINKGVIMINFYLNFVGGANSSIKTIVDHINHVVDVCGIHCIGLGSDYNGVEKLPKGLEDVSKFPQLFDLLKELNPTRWTMRNLEKLAGRNLVRVFQAVENVRDSMKDVLPIEDWISEEDLKAVNDKTLNECTVMPSASNDRKNRL